MTNASDLKLLLAVVLAAVPAAAQLPEKLAIRPEGAPSGPASPALLVGNTLYCSGKTGIEPGAARPATFEDEARQAFGNVRRLLHAAGMDYGNVVSIYLFLDDLGNFKATDTLFRSTFAAKPPVRSILGAGRLPGGARIVVQAIAVQDGAPRELYRLLGDSYLTGAVKVNGIVYTAGIGTRDPWSGERPKTSRLEIRQALANLGAVLRPAGVDYRHVAFVNPYLAPKLPRGDLDTVYRQFFEFGNTPARATLDLAGIPGGEPIELSAVAVADLKERKVIRPISRELSPTASPAVFAGDALYFSGFSGFMPGYGTVSADFDVQLRFAMRNIQDCLESAGLTFENMVMVNAYLGNLDDSERMMRLYREYFPKIPPALTVVQQSPTSPSNRPIVQFTGIAIRSVTMRGIR